VSRLDSLIRRLQAQHACLAAAIQRTADVPGPIFEVGLGNGRTYDHLRELCPRREIFVFERHAPADTSLGPTGRHLILGDIRETLPAALAGFAGRVALIHSDIGTGDSARNARLAGEITGPLANLLAPGGVIVSDSALPGAEDLAVALPAGVAPDRYFLYRRPQ
jgi:S-adenosyl-L-methionine methyltransferase